MNTRNIAVTSALVCALATGAYAQGAQTPRSRQQLQAQGLRQASLGRLTIPVTGTLADPNTPVEPPTPSEPPATPPTTPPPSEPPVTPPTEPPPTEPPPTTPTTPTTPTEPTTPTAPTTPGADDSVPDVTGSFSIRRFAQTTEGEVAAVGILTLSLTDPASNAARTIITQVAMPVSRSGGEATPPSPPATAATPAAQACEALSLTLGAVDLDVLGMTVRLDQINLDLVPRSSARLGMLLCGATSVIDNGAGPAEQMNILNTLLDAVG